MLCWSVQTQPDIKDRSFYFTLSLAHIVRQKLAALPTFRHSQFHLLSRCRRYGTYFTQVITDYVDCKIISSLADPFDLTHTYSHSNERVDVKFLLIFCMRFSVFILIVKTCMAKYNVNDVSY